MWWRWYHMTYYKIAFGKDLCGLESSVGSFLDENYKVHGQPFLYEDNWFQPMILKMWMLE
jgi:hypothetical protein